MLIFLNLFEGAKEFLCIQSILHFHIRLAVSKIYELTIEFLCVNLNYVKAFFTKTLKDITEYKESAAQDCRCTVII